MLAHGNIAALFVVREVKVASRIDDQGNRSG
jgi:hypothetical protein